MLTTHQLCLKTRGRLPKFNKGSRSRALAGHPQRNAVCYRVTTMKPKKPNSAIRKIAKVKLPNKRRITCYIQGRGHELREFSHVMVRGGHVPDLPGVQYHLIRGKYDFLWREREARVHSRSKYGIPRDQTQKIFR